MSPQEGQGLDLRRPSVESLEQLTYTSCVIKETLRMNPPVPGGFRVALKTFRLGVGPPGVPVPVPTEPVHIQTSED